MCGLVGIAGNLFGPHLEMMEVLLHIDMLRGEHSCGVFTVGSNYDLNVAKTTESPLSFVNSSKYKKIVDTNCSVIIGHNRKATVGAVNEANAHPFAWSNGGGAHNGTLREYSQISIKKECLSSETDSEQLLASLISSGIQETIPKINGAWAVTWFDKKTKKLWFLRNAERPLYWALCDRDVLVWSSDPLYIQFAAHAAKVKIIKQPVEFIANQPYCISVPDRNTKYKLDSVTPRPFGMPVSGKSFATATHHKGGSYYNYEDYSDVNDWMSSRSSLLPPPPSPPPPPPNNVLANTKKQTRLFPVPTLLSGQPLTKLEFEEATDCGCYLCGVVAPEWGSEEAAKWKHDGEKFICHSCSEELKGVHRHAM